MAINFLSNQSVAGELTVSTINLIGSDTDKFLMSDGGVIKYVTGANLLSYIGAGTSSTDYYVTSTTFNTSTGVLSLLRTDLPTLTQDLDGRYIEIGDSVNIGNSNLTTDAIDRQLILYNASSRFAILRTGGAELVAQFYPDIVSFNSNNVYITSPTGVTSAPILYLREADSNGTDQIGLRAPANLAASKTYTLPGTAPTAGQVLSSSAAGIMSWKDASVNINIANTNLTADASRTLTLGTNSLTFLDDNADSIIKFAKSGVETHTATFAIRTHSTTIAPTLRLASGTSNYYTGIKSPDTLSGTRNYILPTAYGAAGEVLGVQAAGSVSQQMEWVSASGGSTRSLITSGGGRILIGTSTDSGLRGLVLGGSIGFNYYNWTTQMRYSNIVNLSGLSTPGTTIENISPYYANQGAFQALASGDVVIQGTIEGPNSTDIYSEFLYIYVFKVPAAIVTAMGNGNPQNNTNYSLVASASCRMPASSATTRPQSFISSNGVSVSQGDWVFAAVTFDAAVTSNRYFNVNFQMYTS